ncbi:MAG TPA: hypothetical protein VE978_04345 [Chitinophagales bacterium]|nr:hypothetical protein [Chitinophagales bacterium]
MLTISSLSQTTKKFPLYFNSVSLEFAAPVTYIQDIISWHRFNPPYSVILFPSAFINYERRIKNKFYGEGGFEYGGRTSGFSISSDTFHYRYSDYNIYAGVVFKQKIFRNFYFTPSFDFYYTKQKSWSKDSLIRNVNYYGIGPTIGIEYYFSNRFSMNTDIVSIALGNISGMFDQLSGRTALIATNGEYPRYQFWIYKAFSLGIHYNFDWKKKH